VARKLYEAFHTNKEFKGYDINVTAKNGHVNLQGIVDVLADIDRAVEFAQEFPGVRTVENGLTISTDGALDDDDVYLEVTQELEGDPRVNEEKIHFTVEKGVVTLLGETDSADVREAAAKVAAKARGVRNVRNNIKRIKTARGRGPQMP
jgi:hyperosmotically inducible periplasmic protein